MAWTAASGEFSSGRTSPLDKTSRIGSNPRMARKTRAYSPDRKRLMSKSPKEPLTNAQFARYISHVCRTATTTLVTLTEGMWNSEYCAAPADMYARSVIVDLEDQIKWIKKQLK